MDPIERQAALDAIDEIESEVADGDGFQYEKWRQFFCDLPSAQPERKKGRWIKKMSVNKTEKYISYDPEWYCACCGTKYDSCIAKIVNFCYVCGAEMEKGEDDVSN